MLFPRVGGLTTDSTCDNMHCVEQPAGPSAREHSWVPASRRRPPLYKRHPALQPQQSNARPEPDKRTVLLTPAGGEGGPQTMGGRAAAAHRSPGPSQKPTPEDPAPSSGPAAYASVALQPQTVVLGSAPNWGIYWREEDNYNRCLFHMVN